MPPSRRRSHGHIPNPCRSVTGRTASSTHDDNLVYSAVCLLRDRNAEFTIIIGYQAQVNREILHILFLVVSAHHFRYATRTNRLYFRTKSCAGEQSSPVSINITHNPLDPASRRPLHRFACFPRQYCRLEINDTVLIL